jgi:hypothetical protein
MAEVKARKLRRVLGIYAGVGRDPVFTSLHGDRTFDSLLTAIEHTVIALRAGARIPQEDMNP